MNRFSQIPKVNLPRSSFNLSHSLKTTFYEGKLIPILCQEVYPGDSFNCDLSTFCRLASPLSVPIMDNLYLDFHFFFVPNRLVWNNWEKLMGERTNPNDSIDYLVPQAGQGSGSAVGFQDLFDYFGVPKGVVNLDFSALPFRAYWRVWNEWFRDENLQDSAPVTLGDTGVFESGSSFEFTANTVAPRGKRHDYFTSALPWPQRGPGVELPIGGTAPVVGNGFPMHFAFDGSDSSMANSGSNTPSPLMGYNSGSVGVTNFCSLGQNIPPSTGQTAGLPTAYGYLSDNPATSGVVADLTSATAVTINALRQAFMIQSLLELDARGGTRYNEIILSHFGVVSPDARLQRTEFLGGFSQNIVINTVAQTSSTDGETPQANLAAYGVSATSQHGFTKSFVEHGLIIGLASVRAELTYQQGLPRWMSRRTRYDFYDPMFAHLGEQAILNKEIYAQGNNVLNDEGGKVDDEVFGYQEHWMELRTAQNRVTGKFRSNAPGTLDVFHLAQNFTALPALNSSFIQENAPIDRVVAVRNEPHFLLDVYFDIKAARALPVYSKPATLSRF